MILFPQCFARTVDERVIVDVAQGHDVDFEIRTCCQGSLVLLKVVYRLNLHAITLTPHELVSTAKGASVNLIRS